MYFGTGIYRTLKMNAMIGLLLSAIYLFTADCNQSVINPKERLNSLEETELLTYFLLRKYNYFNGDNKINYIDSEQSVRHKETESDVESKLLLFIENLKDNKLIQHINNSSFSSLDATVRNCDNLDDVIKELKLKTSIQEVKSLCEAANSCKTPQELFEMVKVQMSSRSNGVHSVPILLSQSIVKLCPLVLFQLQDPKCIEQREIHYISLNRPSSGAVWGFGILFVTIVSFCSLIGVGFLPLLTKSTYEVMLTLFEGLAVGSLVGSAIFHLIPQAFNLSRSGSHDYLWKALIIFGGIYLFFWSERIMKMVVEFRRKKKLNIESIPSCTSAELEPHKFSHKQVYFKDLNYDKPNGVTKSNENLSEMEITSPEKSSDNECDPQNKVLENQENGELSEKRSESLILDSIARERSRSNSFNLRHGHSHGGDQRTEIATVAWMIIFGDGLHNFIDGITIGAAFSQSILEGISISVAVICEEFPHELGDFAVLIASGMTIREALGYNFLSACTCYLGLAFGILLGDLADASPYVFALAGGMFLYIALVDMMGELSAALDRARLQGMSQTFKVLLLQNIGILLGVFTLLFLAKYGDKINFEGLAPPKQSDIPFTES